MQIKVRGRGDLKREEQAREFKDKKNVSDKTKNKAKLNMEHETQDMARKAQSQVEFQ